MRKIVGNLVLGCVPLLLAMNCVFSVRQYLIKNIRKLIKQHVKTSTTSTSTAGTRTGETITNNRNNNKPKDKQKEED